jgi:tetratricopeptide (TPR) repeat protein
MATTPLALTGAAHVLGVLADDTAGALAAAAQALTLNPYSPGCDCGRLGVLLAGDAEASVAHFRRAIRLSPHDASASHAHAGLGFALLMAGQPAEALACAGAALRVLPAHPIGHRVGIAALHALGRRDEAVAAGHRYRAALADKAGVDEATIRKRIPDPGFADRSARALREAGLPD